MPDRGGHRPDRPRQRGDGTPLAQALSGRGGRRGSERRATAGRPAQGHRRVPRGTDPRCSPPSPQPGFAILAVDLAAPSRLHGRNHGHPGDLRERTGTLEGHGDRLEPSPAHHHESRPRVRPQTKAIEEARDSLHPADHFYYADEFNLSWMPTLKAIWGPKGQQVMIPTPAQPK